MVYLASTDYYPKKLDAIKSRWRDFSPHDITQAAELPKWEVIVKDIYSMINMIDDMGHVYDDGFQDGSEEGYERGFIDGEESDK